MGYRNDQFFNLNNAGENNKTLSLKPWNIQADNPPFSYPDRTVRTQELGLLSKKPVNFAKQLKRGYIRNLPIVNEDGSNVRALSKCQFQFNPTTLQQTVNQASSFLNILQQDAAQYSQPMPGNVNFSFQLFFDRSMELNNAGPEFDRSNPVYDTTNPWANSSPSQVGVLADLSALFNVIGQGLPSKSGGTRANEILDYTTQQIGKQIRIEAQAEIDGGGDVTSDDATALINEALIPYTNANAGNAGILIPLPVRIVFSSLYIVEGFVTATSVTFTKFNTALVPMQCAVNLTVEGKYIGFAKKNTYLTWALEQNKNFIQDQIAAEVDANKRNLAALNGALNKIEVRYTDIKLKNQDYDRAEEFFSRQEFYEYGLSPNFGTAFSMYSILKAGNEYQTIWRAPNTSKNDPIANLISPGGLSIQLQLLVEADLVSLPILPGGAASTQASLKSTFESNIDKQVLNPKLAGFGSGNTGAFETVSDILSGGPVLGGTVVTTVDDWVKLTSLSFTNGMSKPASSRKITDDEWLNNYFLIRYRAVGSCTIDGIQYTATGEFYKLYTPGEIDQAEVANDGVGQGLINTVNLFWDSEYVVPPTFQEPTNIGTGNVETDPKSPGSVSSIGKPENRT